MAWTLRCALSEIRLSHALKV
ncbi:hypothetical protein LINPERPRIM_LOCUS22398 [Linum perenne]